MDLKNFILIVVVLVVAGVVGIWLPYERYWRTQGQSPPAPILKDSEVLVRYSDHGFEPQTLTVKASTTVAWINVSGYPLWIASDPHPTHTDLPGFDERGSISVDTEASFADFFTPVVYAHGPSVYEYTFTKIGTWQYHNHLNPTDRGVIIVQY